MNFNIVSLFSGAGGMDLGFKNKGYDIELAVEIDKNFASTYQHNISDDILITDINSIDNSYFNKFRNKVFGVIGGPPCQGFSLAGNNARNFIDDPRNYLFKRFLEIVEIINPSFVLIENVANIMKHHNGNTVKEIEKVLNDLGYIVCYDVIDSKFFEIPQSRRRFLLVAYKNSIKDFTFSSLNQNTNFKTIGDAIDDLPSLNSGESSENIYNHISMNHTEQMLKKMKYIPEGGNRNHIPESIRPKSGDQRKYIRLDRNQVGYCVTGDMRKIFHYRDNRALTVRELARLQTFPDWFEFKGPSISQQQQVGNAVPVKLAEKIAERIKNIYEISNN